MAWLETDVLSNQNISSALEIGSYTATDDGTIFVDASVDQVAGSGDYVFYITRQINGAGSAYIVGPKTTFTAAAGETALSVQSGALTVRTGDILKVYVDGLAGDTTTPDTTVRWYNWTPLQPADTLARVTLVDTTTTSTISPTVTVTAAQAAALASGSLAIVTADTFSQGVSVTSTANLSAASKVWFVVKATRETADSASILFIEKTAGLTVVKGVVYATVAHGTIVITGSSGAWTVTIGINEAVTALLGDYIGQPVYAAIKYSLSGSDVTVWDGTVTVTTGIIQAVA